jgi:hypothetical protein
MSDWLWGIAIVLLVFLLTGRDCPADGLDYLPHQGMTVEQSPPRYAYRENPCGEPDRFSAPAERVHQNDIAIPEPSPFYLLLASGVVALGWRRL